MPRVTRKLGLGGFNLYNYASNNPQLWVDPNGMYPSAGEMFSLELFGPPNPNDPWDFFRKASQKYSELIIEMEKANASGRPSPESHPGLLENHELPSGRTRRELLEDLLDDIVDTFPPIEPLGLDDDPFGENNYGENILIDVSATEVGTTQTNVLRSFDPNDKLGPAGFGDENFVAMTDGQPVAMPYTVMFENQATATAPAQWIRVSDPLDDDLDLTTFELTGFMLGGEIFAIPAGLDAYEAMLPVTIEGHELVIEIEIELDRSTRELAVSFMALDPDTGWMPENPMIGLLYPNDENGRGDGSVSYIVNTNPDLPTGTVIDGEATIWFDFNDPISTTETPPLYINTIDASKPTSAVDALPAASGEVDFIVSWSGNDDADGSGIVTYDIYVSTDDGAWTLWLDETEQAEATFNGELGHTYAFYSRAIDGVGHLEDAPAVSDAFILIADLVPPVVSEVVINRGLALQSTINTLTAGFSENVTVTPGALRLYNHTMSQDVTPPEGIAYDPVTGGWDMSGIVFTDGNYTARLTAAGVTDAYGNELDGNGDGIGGDDYTFEFYILCGDIDGGRQVGAGDLETFVGQFGLSGTDLASDLNDDGTVDLGDFAIVRSGYGSVIDERCMLLGDADYNGVVDIDDLRVVVNTFGQTGNIGTLQGDFDRNGVVDDVDIDIWLSVYSPTPPSPVASPETPPAAGGEAGLDVLAVPGLVTSVNQEIVIVEAIAPRDVKAATGRRTPNNDAAAAIDLLVESPSAADYIFGAQAISVGLPATTLQLAATGEYDLRPLGDDPAAGEADDLLVDVLAEASLAVPL